MMGKLVIAIVGVILGISLYWMFSKEEKVIRIKESEIFMDPFELSTKGYDNLRILDCSLGNGTEFAKESIPFSDFVDVEHTLINPLGTFPNTYPTPEIVKSRMERLGLSLNDTIILYTQANIPGAGRVYHILKNHGFNDVKILNGDLGYWKKRGLPVVPGIMRVYPPSILPNLTLDSTSLSEVEQVYAISVEKDLTITLIDVRDPKEYNGTLFSANAVCRPGNICNSVNVPLSEMMTADRRFMNSTEILKLLLSKNIDLSTKFITYSNSGIIASDAYVIFKLILKQQVSVYDGSWRQFGCVFKTQGCEPPLPPTILTDFTKEMFQSLNTLFY